MAKHTDLANRIAELDNQMSVLKNDAAEEDTNKVNRLREIKATKRRLEEKLKLLEEKTDKLITAEMNNNHEKMNIKQYLDRFERDKEHASFICDKVRKERDEHREKMDRVKENEKLRQIKREQEVKDDKLKQIKKIREDRNTAIEAARNRSYFVANLVSEERKEVKESYAYQKLEEKFELQKEEERERLRIEEIKQHLSRRELLKPIVKKELDEFQEKYLELRQKKLIEKEVERLSKQEELPVLRIEHSSNHSKHVEKYVAERNKQQSERNRVAKKVEKIKDFGKMVMSQVVPRRSAEKIRELEERLHDMYEKRVEPHKRKYFPVLLKSPKRIETEVIKERPKAEVKTPMVIRPNYLNQLRSSRENVPKNKIWRKQLESSSDLRRSVGNLQYQLKSYESTTKRNEKLLQSKGGISKNLEFGKEVSDQLVDLITAKLAILDNLTEEVEMENEKVVE